MALKTKSMAPTMNKNETKKELTLDSALYFITIAVIAVNLQQVTQTLAHDTIQKQNDKTYPGRRLRLALPLSIHPASSIDSVRAPPRPTRQLQPARAHNGGRANASPIVQSAWQDLEHRLQVPLLAHR